MALIQGSKVDLVSALNRETPVALDYAGLVFSPVVPLQSDPSGKLVKVRLSTLPTYTYKGNDVLEYSRRNLADLPGIFPVLPRCVPGATLYAMLTALADGTSILFTTDDLEDAPVVTRQDGNYQVQLTAKAGSYAWYGTGLLIFRNLPHISLAVVDNNLSWS